jgi:hypothetical protein
MARKLLCVTVLAVLVAAAFAQTVSCCWRLSPWAERRERGGVTAITRPSAWAAACSTARRAGGRSQRRGLFCGPTAVRVGLREAGWALPCSSHRGCRRELHQQRATRVAPGSSAGALTRGSWASPELRSDAFLLRVCFAGGIGHRPRHQGGHQGHCPGHHNTGGEGHSLRWRHRLAMRAAAAVTGPASLHTPPQLTHTHTLLCPPAPSPSTHTHR